MIAELNERSIAKFLHETEVSPPASGNSTIAGDAPAKTLTKEQIVTNSGYFPR